MRVSNHTKVLLGLTGFVVAITICVTASYYLLAFFDISGLWRTLISLWLGIILFAAFGYVTHYIGNRSGSNNHDKQHGTMLGALEQISQGDFSVFVQTEDHVHAQLADAINSMAKNLGNLETMRQDFISNVTHEIQSPLTSISGFATLLKQDSLPQAERKRYAHIIETESKRLSSLSDNLLKLSALNNNPINKIAFRLDKQLSDVILMLEPQWSAKNLTIEADLQKCTVSGDEDLLSQVWMNLLHNAIKFTPDNGIIYVLLKETTVKITDTGIGIEETDFPRIFERFYKVDKARDRSLGGNGLGLSLVKKIVELHDGRVTVESEAGKGSAFSVFLPTGQ